MRWAWPIAALALAGCVSAPPVACPAPPHTAQASALVVEGYALSGRVVSLLASGKLSGAEAIRLNDELQAAQAEIRAGKTAEARAKINSVKQELQ